MKAIISLLILSAVFTTGMAQQRMPQLRTVIETENVKVETTPSQAGNLLIKVNNSILRTAEPYVWVGTHGDHSTLIVENGEGKQGLIDLTGKVLLECKYKAVTNFSESTVIGYGEDGKRDLYKRPDFQPTDQLVLSVNEQSEIIAMQNYMSAIQSGEALPTYVPKVFMQIYAQANREAEEQAQADKASTRRTRLEEIGYSTETLDKGGSALTVKGHRFEGKDVEMMGDVSRRFWFIKVYVNDDVQHFISVDTETGDAKILTGNVKMYDIGENRNADATGYRDDKKVVTMSTVPYSAAQLKKPGFMVINRVENLSVIRCGTAGYGVYCFGFDQDNGEFYQVDYNPQTRRYEKIK